jgi:hypothetical protein
LGYDLEGLVVTWRNPPPLEPTKAKQGKKITPEDLAKSGTEDGNQMALFCKAAENVGKYPQLKWLHAIPNGGDRNVIEAGKLVAAGTRSGVWDVFLPYPYDGMAGYHGLYIEMKKPNRRNHKNGGLSDEQLEFGQYAEQMGYYCAVCYTWEEAWEILVKYLENKV